MEIGNLLYVSEREDWRAWLEENFQREKEIWLIFPKKSTGKDRLAYNDAVEEALCFGWIDSIIKSVDEDNTAQRFSPRKAKSGYSQANKERLRWLSDHGLLHSSIQRAVSPILQEEFVFPKDIIDAVKANDEAWKNYQSFSPAYRRIRVAYIEAARNRPAEFEKRLSNFIRATEKNKFIGYGGIDKYF
jgi:uncharacterized protein YdeI (YjbR/CyaY-like superfamily)